jgi:hypothetical protein
VYSPGGLIGPPRDARGDVPNAPGREFDSGAPTGYDAYAGADGAEYAEVVREDRSPREYPQSREYSQPSDRDLPLMPVVPPEPADVFVYRDPGGPDEAEERRVTGETARGPFEPMMKSGEITHGDASAVRADNQDVPEPTGRPLEMIRDFYATAEAIGDDNVDRHFDELRQRQRELISEYFKESGSSNPEPGDQATVASEHPA